MENLGAYRVVGGNMQIVGSPAQVVERFVQLKQGGCDGADVLRFCRRFRIFRARGHTTYDQGRTALIATARFSMAGVSGGTFDFHGISASLHS
jgi:hypothetical protein